MANDQGVFFGVLPQGLALRIVGQATMRESIAVKELLEQTVQKGVGRVEVDLSECCHVDSTFLGCLIRVFNMLGGPGSGNFSVTEPSPQVDRCLHAMGLDSFLPTGPASADVEQWHALELPCWEEDTMGKHILDSHRALSEIDERNRKVFEPILEQLARDLALEK